MAGRKRSRDSGAAKAPSKKRRTSTRRLYKRASMFAGETKYFDTTTAFTVPGLADWTGTEVACSSYIQSDGTTVGAYTDAALIPSAIGAGYGQVQGSKYILKKIRIKGQVAMSGTLGDQADGAFGRTVRIVLVQDTQPNGSQAQGEDIFTDLGAANQCNFSFLAMGAGSGGRFRILADKIVALQPSAAQTDGANTGSISFTTPTFKLGHNFKNGLQVLVKANSSTPTVASLSNNNIFMLAHMSSSTPTVTLAAACRAYYVD